MEEKEKREQKGGKNEGKGVFQKKHCPLIEGKKRERYRNPVWGRHKFCGVGSPAQRKAKTQLGTRGRETSMMRRGLMRRQEAGGKLL